MVGVGRKGAFDANSFAPASRRSSSSSRAPTLILRLGGRPDETKLKRAAHRQTLSLLGSIAAALGLIAWAGWEFGFARTTNYQVSKIRSEAHACLDGACQSTGWINVLSRLGERDEAIEGARNVPIEERIPALASLSQTGRTFREAFTRMF